MKNQHQITMSKGAYCLACGEWQVETTLCKVCSSGRVIEADRVGTIDDDTGVKHCGSAVRVLVDIEARSDGSVHATRLYAERPSALRHDSALLEAINQEVQERLKEDIGGADRWLALHVATKHRVLNTVNDVLRPRWPKKMRASEIPVEVGFRLLILNGSTAVQRTEFPWLEILDLDKALARSSSDIKI